MSTVLQFTPRHVAASNTLGRIAKPSAAVIRFADYKQQAPASNAVKTDKQLVDVLSQVRELMWVSPLEQGLIQAMFSGHAAAADYLLARIDTNVTLLANKRDDWRMLWISAGEAEFFSYMEKAGIRAAALRLVELARKDAETRPAREAAVMKALTAALAAMKKPRMKSGSPGMTTQEAGNSGIEIAKPARKKKVSRANAGGARDE